jgi:ATP-binding cassette subfamily B protein
MQKLKFFYQFDDMDCSASATRVLRSCGPAHIRMIASCFGIFPSPAEVKNNSYILKTWVSVLGLQEAAKSIGIDSAALFLSMEDLISNKAAFPCILHWDQNHFVVLNKINAWE